MNTALQMHQLHFKRAIGRHGEFKLEIHAGTSKPSDLDSDTIRLAAYKAAEIIEDAIMQAVIANDPEEQGRASRQREDLIGLFPKPIHVKEIPNQYCSSWCCKHLPWFEVTTVVGVFTIGWRKRVIHIDWSNTHGTGQPSELFQKEKVTMGLASDCRYIHAWSLEDARRYVTTILSSATKPETTSP